ncbi:MAG: hypothetical protein XD89_0032 [Anaerolineae bacterium 49_20]|nr:MAG: hypothetical protein XD89_0032 [Anaerolineae bacterium 49_20]
MILFFNKALNRKYSPRRLEQGTATSRPASAAFRGMLQGLGRGPSPASVCRNRFYLCVDLTVKYLYILAPIVSSKERLQAALRVQHSGECCKA